MAVHKNALIAGVICGVVVLVAVAVALYFTVFNEGLVHHEQDHLFTTTTADDAGCSGSVSTAKRLPNINYAGRGYNVIRGNPHHSLDDPGFTLPVLHLDYSTGAMTSDCQWLIPGNVDVRQVVSCSHTLDAGEIRGAHSYQMSLSVDAEVSAGVGDMFSFTASAGFKHVRDSSINQQRSFVTAVARCIVYRAEINHEYASYKVSKQFSEAVRSLSMKRSDDKAYINFFNTYGTHFTTSLQMGAKAIALSEFESTNWTKLEISGFNFQRGAKASFQMVNAGGSVSSSTEWQQRETFEKARHSVVHSYIGSQPPKDGIWETWSEASGHTPYPIQYKLESLVSLLNVRFFPDIDIHVLNDTKTRFLALIEVYCKELPNCGVPEADRIPLTFVPVNSSIVNQQKVTCPPGLSALSCGIENSGLTELKKRKDSGRFAIPMKDGSCECHDHQGAMCVLWCSNAAKSFDVVSDSTGIRVSSHAACPTGHKVMGCHVRPTTEKETRRANYPTDDGNGCNCYDKYGANCYASCASNIRHHEIRSEYGKYNVTVTCSSNNYVLGCGINPAAFENEKSWRTHAVATSTSCRCSDPKGATCYALCGQFV